MCVCTCVCIVWYFHVISSVATNLINYGGSRCIYLCDILQLFGGLLITLESLPAWIGWMKYLSFVRYIMEVSIFDQTTLAC